MSKCYKCGQPVYFAERKTSLGKDWHWQCLQCQECGRVLNPGQHAEHSGLPYCHIPCYSALFGPVMYGHGSQIEAHNNFGSPQTRRRMPPPNRPDLEEKLHVYNSYNENKSGKLNSKEVNGRLVLEGLLRVYWGVKHPIQLKPRDNIPPQSHWRHSYALAIDNGFYDDLPERKEHSTLYNSVERPSLPDEEPEHPVSNRTPPRRSQTVTYRRNKPDRKIRKRYSINGHFYNQETCVFTPVYGTVTSVRVSSLSPVPEVIRLLLAKFKVLNRPEEFCLGVVHKSGETKIIAEDESPMLSRVQLGPFEDDSKIFIMDRGSATDITHEVAQYAGLPIAVLLGFLNKLKEDENLEIRRMKEKHHRLKIQLKLLMEKVVHSSDKCAVMVPL